MPDVSLVASSLSINRSDTDSILSRYTDVASHKLRASLFSFTNQANNYSEKASVPVRKFIRPHHQSGSVYRWYGLADVLNLSVSLCSLLYTLRHAYEQSSQFLTPQEFKQSLQEFHEAEKTPEGFFLATIFTFFLVGFSTLGSHYDENKDAPWVKHLVFYWPYVRDICKEYKWTAKGQWAAFSLMLEYGVAQQSFLIQLMFPLMVIGGTLSAINRVWLRWIRDARKEMVRNNLDLIEGIKAPLHLLDKLPKSFTGFECSLIYLQEKKILYYVDNSGTYQKVEIREEEWTAFYAKVSELQTSNIHNKMKQYFRFLYKNLPQEKLKNKNLPVHFALNHAEIGMHDINTSNLTEEYSQWFDSYVYFSQTDGIEDAQRLYYVTKDGGLVAQENSTFFHKKYQEVQKDKTVLNLSTTQLKSINLSGISGREIGQTYKDFVKTRQNILEKHSDPTKNKIQKQDAWTTWLEPISSGGSAIGNGLYFYFFVAKMTIKYLSPNMAFFMLAASAGLFLICMVTRVAESLDFQRRLQVTILRTEVELSKKDSVMLHEQLENLLDNEEDVDESKLSETITVLKSSMQHRQDQLKLHDIEITTSVLSESLSQHKTATLLLWNELRDELKLSNALQEKLRVKLDRSYWAAALEGMQNGLAIQGAVSSFSFMVSSLCYVSAAACPPAFIIGCLVVGIAAIVVSCLQGIISHFFYLEKVEQTKLELSLQFRGEMLKKMTSDNLSMPNDSRDDVYKSLDCVNNQPLEPPVDFVVIEWSEIFRLLFKGMVKGHNAAMEFFGRLLENTDCEWWMLPIVLAGGALSFAAALGMRATAKGFAVGRPDGNNNANDSAGQVRRFFDESKKKITEDKNDNVDLNGVGNPYKGSDDRSENDENSNSTSKL